MNDYRKQIDEIDIKMMELFKQRMKVVKQIKQYKEKNNLPIYDKKREEQLIQSLATKYNDNETLLYYVEFLNKILQLSKEYQNE